jgi:two-component sensor histidine kinase
VTSSSIPETEIAATLAMAVIASSAAPMLLVDGEAVLLAASDSFYATFALDPAKTIGRYVYELDGGQWDSPRLRAAIGAASSLGTAIEAYELDLRTRHQGIRRIVLKAQRLTYADSGNVRVLLSVADVTDARLAEKLKDDLVREKAVLLQEIQHRVANSLQIIASVLMQSARKVQSDEARGHLHDAHHRVMSIASLQKQLAASNVADVELRPYLTQLCKSIGASMIPDHDQLKLTVKVDDSAVAANISVSIGLIVTELVINALKHAFPDHRRGTIAVDYTSKGLNWTLGVSDDGVGMPVAPHLATSGLGTSIVQALAKQLHARIKVKDIAPGTEVSVIHTQLTAVNDAVGAEPAEVAI